MVHIRTVAPARTARPTDWKARGILLVAGGPAPTGFRALEGGSGGIWHVRRVWHGLYLCVATLASPMTSRVCGPGSFDSIWVGFASAPKATELRFPRVPAGPPFGAFFESLRPTWMTPEPAPSPELDRWRDSAPAASRRSAASTLLYPDFAAVVRLVDARRVSCYGRPWSQAVLDVDVRRVAGAERLLIRDLRAINGVRAESQL